MPYNTLELDSFLLNSINFPLLPPSGHRVSGRPIRTWVVKNETKDTRAVTINGTLSVLIKTRFLHFLQLAIGT